MVEHHKRSVAKKGKFTKGQRISIGRAPVENFEVLTEGLTKEQDYTFDEQSGVITFMKNIDLDKPMKVKFDFPLPPDPILPTEEEMRREKLIWEKMKQIATEELEKEGKL